MEKELKDSGDLECRGSGNHASDKDKEIAMLQLHELRNATDALDVLKKQSAFWGK